MKNEMKTRGIIPTKEADATLCRRVCMLLVCLQAATSIVLSLGFLNPYAWIGLGAIGVAAAITALVGKNNRPARIVSRVLTGLLPVFIVLMGFFSILSAGTHWSVVNADTLFFDLCVLGVPVCGCLLPAAVLLSLRQGVYDRIIAFVGQGVLLLIAVLANVTSARHNVGWLIDNDPVLIGWAVLVGLTTLLAVFCGLMRVVEAPAVLQEGSSLGLDAEDIP